MGTIMKRRYRLSTFETARRWLFLLSVIFFVTGLIMTVFGFAGPIHADSDDVRQTGQRHLQIAGPVFLSVSVATCVIGGIYSRLVKSDWLERLVSMELERRGGPVKGLAVLGHRVSPALLHDPELQRLLLSRLRRRCSAEHCSHTCSSADRRRASLSVLGASSQPAGGGHRKRPSATSCHSAPPATDNAEQVPGIHIQHIEALPYHVAVVTTDCGGGARRSRRACDADVVVHESTMSAAESDNKHRYIVIHNELSSVSSLSYSRSSKASSINMNDVSSLESDTDPATVTMATAAAARRRRHSTQQEPVTSLYAGTAAAAAAAVNRRRFSCEVHHCDNDDDDGTMVAPSDDKRRLASLTPPPGVHRLHRRRRDNSLVVVEVVCDCHAGGKQPTTKNARLRARSASESPTDRSRAARRSTGPASDSEIIVGPSQSPREPGNGGAPVLQAVATTSRRESMATLRRKSSARSMLSTTRIDEVEERQLDGVDDLVNTQQQPLSSDSSAELSARQAETTAGKDQVPETTSAAAQCLGEAGNKVEPDVGQQCRPASVSRKPSVSGSATDLLARLACVRRKMKPAHDVITAV